MRQLEFQSQVDEWIKDFNAKLELCGEVLEKVTENQGILLNMAEQQKEQIKVLREEVSALRLIQILHLRGEVKQQETKHG